MSRKFILVLFAILLVLLLAGCTDQLMVMGASDPASIRLYLINESASKFVCPNPGLCPQGLTTGAHHFLDSPPMLAPGEAVSYTTRQLGGADGVCTGDRPDFMVGLCGWNYGDSPDQMNTMAKQYGGQIGFQFNCGDTVILRWNDAGPAGGTWTSEVLTAPGNKPATMDFQEMGAPAGGSCTG